MDLSLKNRIFTNIQCTRAKEQRIQWPAELRAENLQTFSGPEQKNSEFSGLQNYTQKIYKHSVHQIKRTANSLACKITRRKFTNIQWTRAKEQRIQWPVKLHTENLQTFSGPDQKNSEFSGL